MTYIGNEAFFKCNALIEVYNLGPLELAAGSPDNGYAAYYALVVHRSLDEEPVGEVTTDDGFVFKTYGNLCRLTAYVGNEENIVLGAFEYNGRKITSYSVGEGAFNSRGIVSVSLTEAVTAVGEFAFAGCSRLVEVVFAENSPVTRIESRTFSYCTDLVRIKLPQRTEYIGDYAFFECGSLESVALPEPLQQIGFNAFFGCEKLIRVYNFSALDVKAGSEDNGFVAYYASEVVETLPEPAIDFADGIPADIYMGRRTAFSAETGEKYVEA